MGVTAAQRIESQLRFLKQAVERLERFHAGNYTREINDFCDFFTQDDVVGQLSRALYQRPEAILADEPVSSVDPARARDTVSLLTEVAKEEGMTLMMSLHNLELAREFFPRLIGLRGGRVAFDAAADALPAGAFERLYSLSEEELLG